MSREQYVEEISAGLWRGRYTGHVYDHRGIDAAEILERQESDRQAARSQPVPEEEMERILTPGSTLTHNETASRLRPHIEGLTLTNAEAAASSASGNEVSICMQEFPEVMDTEYNGAQIRDYLDSHGIRSPWTAEHYAAAIRWKMGRGLLQLDQKKLNDKKRAEISTIAKQREQDQPSEAEMYAMPLSDLRRLGGNFWPQ